MKNAAVREMIANQYGVAPSLVDVEFTESMRAGDSTIYAFDVTVFINQDSYEEFSVSVSTGAVRATNTALAAARGEQV